MSGGEHCGKDPPELLFPALVEMRIFQREGKTAASQRGLSARPADFQDGKLRPADEGALKKLRCKARVFQRDQKRQRLFGVRRGKPVPVAEQGLGCLGAGFQGRLCNVKKKSPHHYARFRVARKDIIQNVRPRQLLKLLGGLMRDFLRKFGQ